MVFSLALSSSTERPVRSGTAGLGSMAHFAAIFSMREFTTFALDYSMGTVGTGMSSVSSARLMIPSAKPSSTALFASIHVSASMR